MIFRQRIIAKTQCAGQNCNERDGCARYEQRTPGSPWASFDLERVWFIEPCLHKINSKP